MAKDEKVGARLPDNISNVSFIENQCETLHEYQKYSLDLLYIVSSECVDFIEKVVFYQEEPFGSSSILAQWKVMEIAKDKEAADMAAFAAKMLDPGVLPEPLEPLEVPRSDFIYPEAPQEFDFGPQPVMGALANVSAASDLGWSTTIGGIANLAGSIIPKFF